MRSSGKQECAVGSPSKGLSIVGNSKPTIQTSSEPKYKLSPLKTIWVRIVYNMSIAEWEKMRINLKPSLGLEGVDAKDFQLYATILYNQVWMTRNKVRMD